METKRPSVTVRRRSPAAATVGPASQPGYLLIVRRGVAETTPAAHSAGAVVVLVPTPPCTSDCNADGEVTIDEILTSVSIALGKTASQQCRTGDANTDGQVTVNEIIGGVDNALNGCPRSVAHHSEPQPMPIRSSSRG